MLTTRQKHTRKFHAIQTVCEVQIQHRLDNGHPIPRITWVKGHVLDHPTPGLAPDKRALHECNRRADELCEYATHKTPPVAYELMGQPKHYLRALHDGKPLQHGPQHHVRNRSDRLITERLREHRRQGQLLRGNTSTSLVTAAAKHLGRNSNLREQDGMLTRALTQMLPTKREMARRGDFTAHWISEDEALCTVCAPPHPLTVAHLVTCAACEGVWAGARNKILCEIEKQREKHKNKKEESREKTIDIPDDFPEIRGGKRALPFLDPKHPRMINMHGEASSEHPELLPRDLPCPDPAPLARPPKSQPPNSQQIAEAYSDLNSTNPIRTCLGAPPKQLPALLSILGASAKTTCDIWAHLFAPQLMTALSKCLTIQNTKCGHTECTIPNCERCAAGEEKGAKRKRRKLTPGAYAMAEG